MRAEIIVFALVAVLCCESTYLSGNYGAGYGYSVPGLGYSGLGLNAVKVPYSYGASGLPYSSVGVVKPYTYPLDTYGSLAYNDVYGSNYAVVDAGYGGAGVLGKGLGGAYATAPLKYGYGSNLGNLGLYGGNYAYVVKK
ncbi:hypothetical protein NPIL_417021 [Nephila pilipes]|uniref:Uncharacterized protein n=1 Tax=Nephila pilipes TaxID=299642 RepID=A0A8X6R2L9_NEPPI|nr:hypothetical protein NPIL_417021 [Nephila pilipes]